MVLEEEEEEEETPSSNKSAKRLGQPLAKRSRSVANQSGGVADDVGVAAGRTAATR